MDAEIGLALKPVPLDIAFFIDPALAGGGVFARLEASPGPVAFPGQGVDVFELELTFIGIKGLLVCRAPLSPPPE
jgi:hypothetical protein